MEIKVRNLVKILEAYFPVHLAESWDNVGLQVGSYNAPVKRVLVTLDLDQEALQYAIDQQADMIVTHHPLIFSAIKCINYEEYQGGLLKRIIEAGITVYSAHTNLDAGKQGLNQLLAERIGLHDIKPFPTGYQEALYKFVIYVPVGHEESVRQAMHKAGAGHLGCYSDCSFSSEGIGLFKPLEGSSPFIGQTGVLEEVREFRLETVVPQAGISKVVQEVLKIHPYEEPAYDIYKLENRGSIYSMGRTGKTTEKMTLHQLCLNVKKSLNLDSIRFVGNVDRLVNKIAVVSGAGTSFMRQVKTQGCEVLLTGDLKYHEAKEAEAMGLAVIDAGHQGTESIMADYLRDLLNQESKKQGMEIEVISLNGRECIITI